MNDNQNNSNNEDKKTDTITQILIGFGISAAAYSLIILMANLINTMIFTAIMAFVIIAVFSFLIVRFFRTGLKAAAITMLIFISPLIIFLMLFGACILAINPL